MQVYTEVGLTQVHAKVGQLQATNQPVQAQFWPKRVYPNKKVSNGSALHLI
jgi:hypothetical protein